jgi:hypothetical protein
MGVWYCDKCGTKNTGTNKHCSNEECKDAHRQLIDKEPYILEDGAEVISTNAGPPPKPNWMCRCGVENAGTDNVCADCGEPHDGDDIDNVVTDYVDPGFPTTEPVVEPEVLETDEVNLIVDKMADDLQVLETEPMRLPRRTVSSRHIRRQRTYKFGDHADPDRSYSDPTNDELAARRSKVAFVGDLLGRLHVPRRLILAIVGAVAAVAVLWGGGTWVYNNFIAAEPVDLTVKSRYWEFGTEVEEFRTLRYEGWDVPPDGRVISQSEKFRTYKQVPDGYETKHRTVKDKVPTGTTHEEKYNCRTKTTDNGDGTFDRDTVCDTRDVPDYKTVERKESYKVQKYRDVAVYDIWFVYVIDKWETDHFVKASGESNPYWPQADPKGPKQRAGSAGDDDDSYQIFEVTIVDEQGRVYSRKTDEAIWSRLEVGEILQGSQNVRSGRIREVEWPTS